MKKFIIDDLLEVAEAMYDEIVDNKKNDVLFVGFYDEAIAVIKELMMYEEVIPHSLEIHPEEWDLYSKEYYVALDDNMELWCLPAMYEDRYLMHDVDITFIMGECSSTILKTIRTDETVEVSLEEEDADVCYGECCCCKCNDKDNSEHSVNTRVAVDDKGVIRGFKKEWISTEDGIHYYSSYSHYSNDQDIIEKLMKTFNVEWK